MKVKYNIGLSEVATIWIKNGMILLDLIIVQYLSKILMPIIAINRIFKKELKKEKKIVFLKRRCI